MIIVSRILEYTRYLTLCDLFCNGYLKANIKSIANEMFIVAAKVKPPEKNAKYAKIKSMRARYSPTAPLLNVVRARTLYNFRSHIYLLANAA